MKLRAGVAAPFAAALSAILTPMPLLAPVTNAIRSEVFVAFASSLETARN